MLTQACYPGSALREPAAEVDHLSGVAWGDKQNVDGGLLRSRGNGLFHRQFTELMQDSGDARAGAKIAHKLACPDGSLYRALPCGLFIGRSRGLHV